MLVLERSEHGLCSRLVRGMRHRVATINFFSPITGLSRRIKLLYGTVSVADTSACITITHLINTGLTPIHMSAAVAPTPSAALGSVWNRDAGRLFQIGAACPLTISFRSPGALSHPMSMIAKATRRDSGIVTPSATAAESGSTWPQRGVGMRRNPKSPRAIFASCFDARRRNVCMFVEITICADIFVPSSGPPSHSQPPHLRLPP